MWWSNKYGWLLGGVLLLLQAGCKAPFDPAMDTTGGREVSIHYLKSQYAGQPLRITEDYVLLGQVISSDEQGNFRWTLVVEDETGGIELKIGLNPYHGQFPIGGLVRVKCAGLVLGAYGRTIQLGAGSDNAGYETGFIDSDRIPEHIIPTGELNTITPALLGPGDLSMRYVDCAVRVDGVRFIDEEQGLAWGDGESYTERHLLFTESPADTLAVRTSPHAGFAAEPLPAGAGSLEGILTQFAGNYSLVLNQKQEFGLTSVCRMNWRF